MAAADRNPPIWHIPCSADPLTGTRADLNPIDPNTGGGHRYATSGPWRNESTASAVDISRSPGTGCAPTAARRGGYDRRSIPVKSFSPLPVSLVSSSNPNLRRTDPSNILSRTVAGIFRREHASHPSDTEGNGRPSSGLLERKDELHQLRHQAERGAAIRRKGEAKRKHHLQKPNSASMASTSSWECSALSTSL